MIKISIIVPIYNVSYFLVECLESLINQTLKEIQIICVNDGSTDNSLAILNDYAIRDPRICVIDKDNTGYGNTMNIGISHAKGEYIGIVESDDFADLNMFEKLYKIATDSNAEVAKGNYIDYSTLQGEQKKNVEILKGLEYNKVFKPIEKQEIFYVAPTIWSAIYRTDFIERNHIQFNETPGASYQDTSFNFQVWACTKQAVLVKDAFIYYRTDNAGSSVHSPDKVFCIFDEYKKIQEFLEQWSEKKHELASVQAKLKINAYKSFYYHVASAFQYTLLLKMSEELNEDYEKHLLRKEYFEISTWNEILQIMHNPNKYFKETAKDYKDERLNFFSNQNLQVFIKGLLQIAKNYKRFAIYGAGVIGKKIAVRLIDEGMDIDCMCFAVSDKKEDNKIYNISILEIDSLSETKEETFILVATKEIFQYEILSKLQELKFPKVAFLDARLIKELL